ncbi:MAG: F0F1 ATP synthase subunit delta, partial [Clostridia bacterium]|nr:F0F1 ATP synthase subunit delta [Clostridia bacterium]
MEIIYYLINFAILAGIIFLFGRNFIISLFRTRRVGIEDALDRAEHPELFEETKEAGETENSENASAETASAAEENRVPEKVQLTAAEAAAASVADRVQKIEKFGEQECREIRRGMLGKVRSDAMDVFCDKVSARFTRSAYAEQLRQKEPVIVETILEKIKLTPGDMAYLKRHDVLYVTLTSAYHLEDWLVKKIEAAATALVEPIHGKISYWVQVDPTLLGGLRLRIGDTVYDGTLSNILYNYRTAVKKNPVTGEETAETYEELFRKISGKVAPELDIYQRGRAITVSDGICWMDGLADIMYGEVVEFECGERGMVLDIQHDRIGCVVFGQYERIESGSPVRRAGRIASVPVGEGLLGRVIDAIGNPIDGKGYIPHTERRPVEFHAPGILDRAPVKEPLHTGIKAIDALVPIGKGQRELLIGDRQTGKT